MDKADWAMVGFASGLLSTVAVAFIAHSEPDYLVVAPHKPSGDALHGQDGKPAANSYQFDADEWEVVATVDDRLVLRRKKEAR